MVIAVLHGTGRTTAKEIHLIVLVLGQTVLLDRKILNHYREQNAKRINFIEGELIFTESLQIINFISASHVILYLCHLPSDEQ